MIRRMGERTEYVVRLLITVFYFCTSLSTSTLILFYSSLLGSGNAFTMRVRSIFSVVTCAPWLLFFGIRLAIQDEDLVFSGSESTRTVNIGTHASHIDGLSMMVAYWRNRHRHIPPCAVVKREVLLTPFYGPFANFVGNVLVARGSTKREAIESMQTVSRRMREGYVIGAFPEGSRRRTPSYGKDHLLPFKKGVFHMMTKAVEEGVSVVVSPFCLIGSRTAWPKGRLIPTPGSKVLLKFCPQFNVRSNDSPNDVAERTERAIKEGIESVCRNKNGEYDVDAAFEKGMEVNLKREFTFEAILLTLPPMITLYLAFKGML